MKNKFNLWRLFLIGFTSGCFFLGHSISAFAHRDDYIDETLVYLTLEKKEIEPEYFFDFGHRSEDGSKIDFVRHNVALEYGITDYCMVDGRLTIEKNHDESADFQSGRLETRYRFFEEGEKPIDVAVSAEINTQRNSEGDFQTAIEPRLILSKDFDKLNFTLNLPVEIPFDSGSAEFIPSFGWRYNAGEVIRFGSEVKENTDTHEGSIIPQIWFALPHETTIKIGYSFGFDKNDEDFLRIAVEGGF